MEESLYHRLEAGFLVELTATKRLRLHIRDSNHPRRSLLLQQAALNAGLADWCQSQDTQPVVPLRRHPQPIR